MKGTHKHRLNFGWRGSAIPPSPVPILISYAFKQTSGAGALAQTPLSNVLCSALAYCFFSPTSRFAALSPSLIASASVMYLPFLVVP